MGIWGGGTACALILSYLVFIFGYLRKVKGEKPKGAFSGDLNGVAFRLAISFLLIGGIAMVYHVTLIGGFVETLKLAPRVRTGEFALDGRMLFIRQFLYFLATGFMLYWAICLDRVGAKRQLSMRSQLLLVSFSLFFLYYALSTYGRREFVYPMMICLVIWAVVGERRWWGGLALLGILDAIWFAGYSIWIPAATNQAVAEFFWEA